MQERQAAAHHLRGGQAGATAFAAQVEAAVRKVHSYEDELAQALALSVIPMEQLEASVNEAVSTSAAMGEVPPLDSTDALAQELLTWFKRDFFSWVNNPPCATCAATTQAAGVAPPTGDEAAELAGRTELYRCTRCGATTRFPRYNAPTKLLETRRGRCGEWANAFALCCRAAGLEARLAFDWGDHIWVEYWSPALQRWVHLDPCEAAYDQPLLYEAGWGKQLSYVVGVGRHGVVDVTRRYTRRYTELLARRRLVSEEWLVGFQRHLTSQLRAPLAPHQRAELAARDSAEQAELAAAEEQPSSGAEVAHLPGRQTGDAAWLAARGEDGSSIAAKRSPVGGSGSGDGGAPVPPPGTHYKLAKDERLGGGQPLRLCGGAVRASGENGPSEPATAAFDGKHHTKWLDFGGKRCNGAWLEYRLPAETPTAVLGSYALTSANDCPERDPRHVVLEAWAEETDSWVVLDERQDLHFPTRHHRLLLPVEGRPSPSRRFRLRVVAVADATSANSVQLACLDLYRREAEQAQRDSRQPQQHAAQEQQQQEQQQQQQQQEQQQQQQQQQQQEEQEQEQEQPSEALAPVASVQQQQAQQAVAPSQPPSQQQGGQDGVPTSSGVPPAGSGAASDSAGNPWAALFQPLQLTEPGPSPL